jgi:gliding motility-associated-like protein
VTEYRNGIELSLHRIDFQFNVTQCTLPPIASVPALLNDCDNSVFTFPNYSTGASSYHWDFGVPGINSDTSVLFSPTYTYADTGVYTVTLYANPGALCADTATIQVYVYPNLTGHISAPDGCEGIPVQFFDSSTTTYGTIASWSWNFANLGFSALQNPTYTFNTAGIYLITLIVGNTLGCVDTVSTSITINPQPLAFAAPNSTICSLDTIQLFGSGAGNYLWLPNYGLSNNSVQNPLASPDVTTQYILQVTNSWGCFDKDTITITVIQPVAALPAVLNGCNDFVFTFPNYSTGATAFSWDFGVPGINSDTSILFSPTYTYPDTGVYTVTLYANPGALCGDTATIEVYVYPIFTGNIIAPDGCEGVPVQFFDSSTTTYGTIDSWSWNFGNLGFSALQNPSYIFNTAGVYLITLIVGNTMGCVDTVSTSITVNPKPLAFAGSDTTICSLDTIQLFGGGIGNYLWLPNYNLSNNSVQNPLASPDVTTQYILQITNSWGCIDTDAITISVFEPVTALPAVLNGCDEFVFTFPNYTIGATAFFWNFGVPGINSDTSVLFNPAYTYTDTGVYTVTLYANPGTLCGDTATVQVYVYPTFTGNIVAPDGCEGIAVQFFDSSSTTYGNIDSWSWNFANLGFSALQNPAYTFNTAGVYLITLIVGNSMGCADTISASITINPKPVAFAGPDTTICSLDTIQLFGSGIGNYIWLPNYNLSNNSVQNPFASPDVSTQYILQVTDPWGCFDEDSITITVFEPVTALPAVLNSCDDFVFTFPNYSIGANSFFWDFGVSGINSDTSILFSPTYTYSDTGVYTITLYANPGTACGGMAIAQVYVYPTFTGNIIAPDGCEGIPVQFFDSSTTTYGTINSWSWNFGNLGFSSLENPSYAFSTPGIYLISLIVGNTMGCVDTVSVSITINAKPVAIAWPDTSICYLDTIQLFGSGTGSYQWFPNYGLANSSVQNPFASPDVTTQYILQVTDPWGCFDKDTITIIVIDSVNVIAGNDTMICPLGQAQLNASGGFNYFWQPPAGLSNQSIPNPVASPAISTTYTVKSLPIITSGPDQTICIGDSVMIEACCGFNYLWDPANTLTDPYIATPIAFPSSATVYHVAVDDTGSCPFTIIDSVTVFVIIPTPLIITPDTVIFPGTSVQLYATGAEHYLWTPSTALSDQYIFNPIASPTETIEYYVYATTAEGCKLSDSLTITVEIDALVFFPNAFTPNQDGTNDYFHPVVLGYFQTEVFEVFNRWGQLRYKSNDIEPGWDGTFHGQNSEVGTYVYYLKGKFVNSGKPYFKKGNVELLR